MQDVVHYGVMLIPGCVDKKNYAKLSKPTSDKKGYSELVQDSASNNETLIPRLTLVNMSTI